MLQFNENGQIIVPESIQKDLAEQKEANEVGLTVTQFRKLKEQTERHQQRNLHTSEVQVEIQKHANFCKNQMQKFIDEELIELHDRGFSDIEKAKVFKCCHQAIFARRCKLAIVANFKPLYGGENLTEEELKDRWQEMKDRSRERQHCQLIAPEMVL